MQKLEETTVHSFHIPVLGLAFSIDTPLRVARFGISSVVSLVDDILIEHMRKHYSVVYSEPYEPISSKEHDHRARRITAYLNLIHRNVQRQLAEMRASAFQNGSEIVKYFEMLADHSPLKAAYQHMKQTKDEGAKSILQDELRAKVVPGSIDVNIMAKLDKVNVGPGGVPLPVEFSDASASLRGYTESDLESSLILSAGMNPRLYALIAQCKDFFPDQLGKLRKKIILKVSDYRSALIQGKMLAKKGIWVSEFRVESGLNCGGHAFATDGFLLGPILEEFKAKRDQLVSDLHELLASALTQKDRTPPATPMPVRITVQGGIGTANEDKFLREYHGVDGTGWGSPFLLVPEATNVDEETRRMLAKAKQSDYYLSQASPLGIRFNNVRQTTSEQEARRRTDEGRPGSPCTKKYLVTNTEFTAQPICVASRQYQSLKIKQLHESNLTPEILRQELDVLAAKSCLCEDLAASAFIVAEDADPAFSPAVAICPGPNLAFFSRTFSLEEMVSHIYGRVHLLANIERPNMFINELRLYVEYLKEEIARHIGSFTMQKQKQFDKFKANMLEGIEYYKSLIPKFVEETHHYRTTMREHLMDLEREVLEVVIPSAEI